MTSFLICASSLDGHLRPMLTIAGHLVSTGHRVRFLAGERYAGAVAATGAERVHLPEEAQTNLELIAEGKSTDGRRLSGIPQAVKSVRLSFVQQIPAQYAALTAAIDDERPDVVLTESVFLGASVLALRPRAERPAVVSVGVFPLTLISRDTAPPGLGLLPRDGWSGRLRNRVLNLVVRRVLFGGIQREIDAHARSLVGRPLADFFLDTGRSADLFVQLTVPSFEYPRSDAPANLVFLGPLLGTPRDDPQIPDWWGDLDGSRPVVHVTQGTIANLDLGELVLPTVQALADEDVLVVVTGSGPGTEGLGRLPANVRAAAFVDYARLMPLVDVFVTNGGYGALHEALRCGVPIVVAGDTEDKMETSARVEWAGVGLNLRTGTPTPEQVRDAVRKVLRDPVYRERSRRLGDDIRNAPGVAGFDAVLARVLSDTAAQSPTEGGRAAG